MSTEAELQRSYGIEVIDADTAFAAGSSVVPTGPDLRVVVTGAPSTGITTIARQLARSLPAPLITEVARAVFEHGFQPGAEGSMASQSTIWFSQMVLESRARRYVTDRFLLCGLAHAQALADRSGSDADRTCVAAMTNATSFCLPRYDTVFYTPIEFDLVPDGVRNDDDAFRRAVDDRLLELFEQFDVPYVTLRGSIEERLAIAHDALRRHGILANEESTAQRSRWR